MKDARSRWVLASVVIWVLLFGLVAGAQTIVVPAEVRDFCTMWPPYPAPIGGTVCFHRDDDGKLLMKCASDEIPAAMFRVPLCSEVWNAGDR